MTFSLAPKNPVLALLGLWTIEAATRDNWPWFHMCPLRHAHPLSCRHHMPRMPYFDRDDTAAMQLATEYVRRTGLEVILRHYNGMTLWTVEFDDGCDTEDGNLGKALMGALHHRLDQGLLNLI